MSEEQKPYTVDSCYHYQRTPQQACSSPPTHLWRREDGERELASCDKHNRQLTIDLANWPLSWSEVQS